MRPSNEINVIPLSRSHAAFQFRFCYIACLWVAIYALLLLPIVIAIDAEIARNSCKKIGLFKKHIDLNAKKNPNKTR